MLSDAAHAVPHALPRLHAPVGRKSRTQPGAGTTTTVLGYLEELFWKTFSERPPRGRSFRRAPSKTSAAEVLQKSTFERPPRSSAEVREGPSNDLHERALWEYLRGAPRSSAELFEVPLSLRVLREDGVDTAPALWSGDPCSTALVLVEGRGSAAAMARALLLAAAAARCAAPPPPTDAPTVQKKKSGRTEEKESGGMLVIPYGFLHFEPRQGSGWLQLPERQSGPVRWTGHRSPRGWALGGVLCHYPAVCAGRAELSTQHVNAKHVTVHARNTELSAQYRSADIRFPNRNRALLPARFRVLGWWRRIRAITAGCMHRMQSVL
eukprot:gene16890-biopygen5075